MHTSTNPLHIPLIPPVILIFIKSHILFFAHPICFAHLTVLLFCTFLYSIAHFTSYFFFYLYIYIYIYILLCGVTLYNLILTLLFIFIYIFSFFNSLHCPLSGPDLNYISLLIIPCIIYHVTIKKPWTLNLEDALSAVSCSLRHSNEPATLLRNERTKKIQIFNYVVGMKRCISLLKSASHSATLSFQPTLTEKKSLVLLTNN